MRIGIISDIHANVIALKTVLQAIAPVDGLWCLGDVVGYGPNPNECVNFLRAQSHLTICLTGNHDGAALGRMDLNDFNPDARQAALWTREHLTAASANFLRERPGKVVRGPEFTLAHASPRQPIWEYIANADVARANFEHFETPICLVGHTHIPAIYALNSNGLVYEHMPTDGLTIQLRDGHRFILNPGSVGQPRDRDPRAAYAIWDSDRGTLTFRRVEYDVDATQQNMEAAGLPERLIVRLAYGR